MTMPTLKTIETVGKIQHNILWNNTGEVLSRIDCYDWTERAGGEDQFGNQWFGYAIMSCDELIEIEEAEILTESITQR